MIDLVVGAGIAFLVVRGWHRGLVREAMDLVGLILGVFLAFRTSGYVGGIVESLLGVSEPVGRFVGGAIVFVAVGIGSAVAARALHRVWSLPGLNLSNRVGGAGLAGAWGLFMVTLLFSVAAMVPTQGVFGGALDDSASARVFTDPDGFPQRAFASLSGDQIVRTILHIRDATGSSRVVVEGTETLSLPPTAASDLREEPGAEEAVAELLNRARVQRGVVPLARSEALDEVARAHASDMYRNGFFSHQSPATGDLADRLATVGIVFGRAGENLALAATADGVHSGLMDSPGHRGNILDESWRRFGVGVVGGPLGLMTVQVFTG